MTVRISFTSLSDPANISKYKVFRADIEAGPYTEITEITHPGAGILLTYDDLTGDNTKFYKLQTVLTTLETSDLSPPFSVAAAQVSNVFGCIINPDGTPVAGATVVAKIASVEDELREKLISKEDISTVTDASGFWSIKLLVDLRVNISIAILNSEKTFCVPNVPAIDYEDIGD